MNLASVCVLLSGCSHVVACTDAFRVPSGGFCIAFPIIDHDDFLFLVQTSGMREIREYMRSLLTALAHVHARVRICVCVCGRLC